MSLILDALRKSEHQRQRQVGPGLAVVPESRGSHRPPAWILLIGGLLALNIIVLGALFLTDRRTGQVAVTPPAGSVAAPVPAPAPAQLRDERLRAAPVTLPSSPPRSDVRPLTTEITAPTSARSPGTQATAPGAVDDAPRAATPAPAVERATEDARLPRFADLVVRGELNVPHMHLDIHVYSTTVAERFVFINMRRYNEGQATQEGPRIERITHDGVVMDFQGRRFFLSRD